MITISIILLGGLGLTFAVILAIVSKIFFVEEDSKKVAVVGLLPGANCGACGFGGCESFSQAIIEGNTQVNKCAALDLEATKKIGIIMGQEVNAVEPKVAVIMCAGGRDCSDRFEYRGVETCYAVNLVFGGHKTCSYGCIGFGDCVRVCPFDAIKYVKGDVPVIDIDKCTGCGLCVKVCPKNIIKLIPEKYSVHIRCASFDKGALVRQICKTGCISCGACVRICPVKDVVMENNLARTKYDKCINCGLCMEKCPVNTIEQLLEPVGK